MEIQLEMKELGKVLFVNASGTGNAEAYFSSNYSFICSIGTKTVSILNIDEIEFYTQEFLQRKYQNDFIVVGTSLSPVVKTK